MSNLTQQNLQQLYEIDDYLWLEETVKLFKANKLDELDLENLIEELESLGRSNLNKVIILLRQIIIHLLLLQYLKKEYNRNHRHWKGEIIAFRDDLNNSLTTSLENKLIQQLEHIYNVAVKFVSQKTGLSKNLFPHDCPYSLEQLLDEDWYPEKPE